MNRSFCVLQRINRIRWHLRTVCDGQNPSSSSSSDSSGSSVSLHSRMWHHSEFKGHIGRLRERERRRMVWLWHDDHPTDYNCLCRGYSSVHKGWPASTLPIWPEDGSLMQQAGRYLCAVNIPVKAQQQQQR